MLHRKSAFSSSWPSSVSFLANKVRSYGTGRVRPVSRNWPGESKRIEASSPIVPVLNSMLDR